MADINVEMLKEKLYVVSKALFCIGEVCVDVSKQHISEEYALNKIRGYLNDAHMWSRFQVDQIIEDCMEPIVINIPDEMSDGWLQKYLKEQPTQTFEVSYPQCCDGCSNNPKNGGSGICNCTLPYMQNPMMYATNASTDDRCMTATTSTGAYIFGKEKSDADNQPKADTKRIAEAVERTQKYLRK
jgi:hypothetical protein